MKPAPPIAGAAPPREAGLFDGGPPLGLLRLWGRIGEGSRNVRRRALAVILIGWLPLLVLALLAQFNERPGVWTAFLHDASAHARTLLVSPLLILAELICIPRLGAIAETFRTRGLVPASQVADFDAILSGVMRLRDSWVAEAAAVVLAYLAAFVLVTFVPTSFLPDWHRGLSEGVQTRSLASWWNALVSLPILLVLLFGWVWRWFLWNRFLWKVSRLDLRLVAAHPEGAAGLMFVGFSLRAFMIIGLAIGVLVAATELAHVLAGSAATPEQLAAVALATVVCVLLLFTAPLLAFTEPLLRTWRAAVISYGALAQRVGQAFEDKWMHNPIDEETAQPLATGDFSAVTDLYQTTSLAYSLRLMPLDLRSLVALAISTALPFGIVALALVPFDKVMDKLLGMFL